MPDGARSSLGQADGDACAIDGPRLDRKGPQRVAEKHDDDVTTARWLDAAITLWGKSTAYAEAIGVDLAHLSRMRTGEKPTSLRHLLPLAGNVEAVLAFAAPLLESIGYVARPKDGPTVEQVAHVALRVLLASPLTREMLERECERQEGWSTDQVNETLTKGNK